MTLDAKREQFCIAYLRNLAANMPRGKAAYAAAQAVGYAGTSLKDNARRLPQNKAIKARLIELIAPQTEQAAAALEVDLAKAKYRLGEIIMAASGIRNVKPDNVIAAVRQLAAIEGWHAPTTVNVNKHVTTDWTTEELLEVLRQYSEYTEGLGGEGAGAVEPGQVH